MTCMGQASKHMHECQLKSPKPRKTCCGDRTRPRCLAPKTWETEEPQNRATAADPNTRLFTIVRSGPGLLLARNSTQQHQAPRPQHKGPPL